MDIEKHLFYLTKSLKDLAGIDLLGDISAKNLKEYFDNQNFVLVSHGTQDDPILNYGNKTALNLWKLTWEEFTNTPSRKTAEAPLREERQKLLDRVTNFGYINDYSGIRIASDGKRFRIDKAIVWNIYNENKTKIGQAATFSEWQYI